MQLPAQPASDWLITLGLLARLHPPQSLVYVGSQAAIAPSRVWQQWSVPHAVIIDPVAPLPENTAQGWHYSQAVVAANVAAAAPFYKASLLPESGLLPPDALRPLWPHIRAISTEQRPTITLEQLWAGLQPEQAMPNWVLVDSLPALPVLQGGAILVAAAQVVCVRVLLLDSPPAALSDCTLPVVKALLRGLGLLCVAVVETHHPGIGLALFVCNWPEQAEQQRYALAQAQTESAHKLKQAGQAQAEAAQQLQEQLQQLQTQLQAESAAKTESQQQHDTLSQAKAQLEQKLQQAAHAQADLTARYDSLAADKATLQSQLSALQTTHDALKNQHTTLEAQTQEQAHRQQLLQEELLKAEVQVELIKDLLLREPSL